jgi:S-formylglutathione hydrolase
LNPLKFILLSAFLLFSQATIFSQNKIALKGSIERIKVHGKSLEGNLEGDSPDRDVSVYLPPSYKSNSKKRYPVIYFLHGYTDSDAKFFGLAKHWMNLPPILDSAFVNGSANEMILVMPNAYTQYQGSWYSNSVTTGNWEDFITTELVKYIDDNYRTIPKAASRGLAGHSMGGYGTLRIGEKHPEIFSCIYLLSPATLYQSGSALSVADFANTDTIKNIADFQKAAFWTKATFAMAAAWSPNPNNPPFYVDLPVKNSQLQYSVVSKWAANMPLTTIDQYIFNLKKLYAIAFDAGTKDESIAASLKILDEDLNKYKVKHFFEIYDGTHINRIVERIKLKMLPFFSSNLSFAQ